MLIEGPLIISKADGVRECLRTVAAVNVWQCMGDALILLHCFFLFCFMIYIGKVNCFVDLLSSILEAPFDDW